MKQYHASKFALEGFTESLRQELNEFGINVILIGLDLSVATLWIILRQLEALIQTNLHMPGFLECRRRD